MSGFIVQATFWLRPNRTYHVTAPDRALYFIRVGGEFLDWSAALAVLGPLGMGLGARLNERRDARRRSAAAEAEALGADVSLHTHAHNFRVDPTDVETSSLEPGSRLGAFGPHLACWRLEIRGRRSWRFQFTDPGDLERALEILPALLGQRLQVDPRLQTPRPGTQYDGSGP
jgi:hypothetical protein